VSDPRDFLSIWRATPLVGSREVIEGIVQPDHAEPSAALAAALAAWPGRWYWGDDAHRRLVLIRGTARSRPERWLWHGGLLLVTIICTLGAGAVLAGQLSPPARPGFSGALYGAGEFFVFVARGGWRVLGSGWEFAVPLLGILLIHELGHYVAARRYEIDVSPPYFLPVPPNLSPIGGMGAFIRLRSAVYDRRQLLDVGAAGPLAGFVAAVGVLIWGYLLSHRATFDLPGSPTVLLFEGHPFFLGDSIITYLLREWLVPGGGPVILSPAAFAGWVGMFITAVNLLPLSQLDGGHVAYGAFGRRQQGVALVAVAALLVLGRQAPLWWVWVALTFVIGRGGWTHPPVVVAGRPVLRRGRLVGALCLMVLVVTFVPNPFLG
jgi:Peptidase family M50